MVEYCIIRVLCVEFKKGEEHPIYGEDFDLWLHSYEDSIDEHFPYGRNNPVYRFNKDNYAFSFQYSSQGKAESMLAMEVGNVGPAEIFEEYLPKLIEYSKIVGDQYFLTLWESDWIGGGGYYDDEAEFSYSLVGLIKPDSLTAALHSEDERTTVSTPSRYQEEF